MKNYQQKMKVAIVRFAVMLILAFSGVFTPFLLLYSLLYGSFAAKQFTEDILPAFEEAYNKIETFIKSDESSQKASALMHGAGGVNDFAYSFTHAMRDAGVSGYIILTDENGNIIYTSLRDHDITEHNKVYNSYLCSSLKNAEMSRSVYYVNAYDSSQAYYVFANPITNSTGVICGSMCIYADFEYWLDKRDLSQADIVLTFGESKVIASSSRVYVDNADQFVLSGLGAYSTYENRSLWLETVRADDAETYIHAIVYMLHIGQYFAFGCIVILIMLVIAVISGNKYAAALARDNSASIAKLYNEIDNVNSSISKNQPDRRIEIHTGDEVEDIAHHINALMDSLDELHSKNAELESLNSAMEIRQLEAKFDPHFLYNTLESIRYSICLGEKGTDGLILRLTEILRYSLDNSNREVYLADDMHYIENYLDIIKFRYGSRMSYDIDIADECCPLLIPKLLLQPLIENSIKYGFMNKGSIHISINGMLNGSTMRLCVIDDGGGMDEKQLERIRALIARAPEGMEHRELQNLNRRLKLIYGSGSGIEICITPDKKTCVCAVIEYGKDENELQRAYRRG